MLGSGHAVSRTYRLGSDGRGAGVQVWMQAYPESDTSPELRLETESLCARARSCPGSLVIMIIEDSLALHYAEVGGDEP
jgi:hypothetical protein